jgi:hypothetical protein
MFDLFLISTKRFLAMVPAALTRSPDGQTPLGVRRVLIMIGFLPLFALVQAIHWLGFLLDDILFRGWRRVEIREPLFVLGVPRSGTTKLHEVMAKDSQYTSFSTWECLFALSVTERRFWLALARLDALIGGPAAGVVGWLERRIFASLDDVHAMSLTSPEEDYFALMPILSCFILFLPFPANEHLHRVGLFDREMPEAERKRILDFYQSCLKRHLYVHGPDKRLLSKNAAFAPLAQSLSRQFPDARFIVCLRDPIETIPSQLSSIGPGLRLFGISEHSAPIRERLLEQLAFYYDNLHALVRSQPAQRCATVTLPELKAGLSAALTGIYAQLGLPLGDDFAAVLRIETPAARGYRSGHRYALAQFGLEPADISTRFASAYWHPGLRGAAETARIGNEGAPKTNLGDLELETAKLSGELAVDGKRPTNRPRGALSC